MKGAEMMLKAMGLDPAELQTKFGEAVKAVQDKAVLLENQMTRIEMAQSTILAQNTAILNFQRKLADALHIEGIDYAEENSGPQFGIDFNGSDGIGQEH